jgi:hypothetical protein
VNFITIFLYVRRGALPRELNIGAIAHNSSKKRNKIKKKQKSPALARRRDCMRLPPPPPYHPPSMEKLTPLRWKSSPPFDGKAHPPSVEKLTAALMI